MVSPLAVNLSKNGPEKRVVSVTERKEGNIDEELDFSLYRRTVGFDGFIKI